MQKVQKSALVSPNYKPKNWLEPRICGTIIWRCRKPKCTGVLHTNLAKAITKHTVCNHKFDYVSNQTAYSLHEIRERGVKTNKSARDIIYDCVKEGTGEELSKLPLFKSITTTLSRQRKRKNLSMNMKSLIYHLL